jgi:hypothetical protein
VFNHILNRKMLNMRHVLKKINIKISYEFKFGFDKKKVCICRGSVAIVYKKMELQMDSKVVVTMLQCENVGVVVGWRLIRKTMSLLRLD